MVSDQQMSAWPADNPERRSIESLIPYAGNPMTHPPAQIELLKRSLREFGWTMPVLVDEDGGIIAGHGRVMAAMQLGIKIVPCLVAKGWPEARKRAYVIADNQYARLGEWDHDLLKVELGDLGELGYDLSLAGFGEIELVEFMTGLPGDGDNGNQAPIDVAKTLAERFGVPPFSVLNAREGWWQDRKRAWIALGIQSELGRGENLLKFSDSVALDGQAYHERFNAQPGRHGRSPQTRTAAQSQASQRPALGGEV